MRSFGAHQWANVRFDTARPGRWWPLWPAALVACVMLAGGAIASFGGFVLDVYEYQCYAVAFWHGANGLRSLPTGQCDLMQSIVGHPLAVQPFHSLPTEYGALALLVFSPPLLAPAAWYPWLFAGEILLIIVVTAALCARYGPPLGGHAYLLYVLLGGWLIAGTRFDAVPGLLTLLAVIWGRQRRTPLAYGALAAATLMKLYPVVLLLPLVVADLRQEGGKLRALRGVALYLTLVVGAIAGSLLIGPADALTPMSYLSRRGIATESLPASLLWLAHTIRGAPLAMVYEANVQTITSPLAGGATAAGMAVFVVIIAVTTWLQWRGRLTLGQACVAILLGLLVGSKVFSPQYLLWVSPLIALEYGADAPWSVLWALACLMTTLAFPVAYEGTVTWGGRQPWEVVTAFSVVRNAVVAGLCVTVLAVRREVGRALRRNDAVLVTSGAP